MNLMSLTPSVHQQGCAVKMQDGEPCSRPLYSAPDHDTIPVCLMHSLDPIKNGINFKKEIENILATAERTKNIADFQNFVFSTCDYYEATFSVACNFSYARFLKTADFGRTTFLRDATFNFATFIGEAGFSQAHFFDTSNFSFAEFRDRANFNSTAFSKSSNFAGALFNKQANFDSTAFNEDVTFHDARFLQDASLRFVLFSRDANFLKVRFDGNVNFQSTLFKSHSDFWLATFKTATFSSCEFSQSAQFVGATFSEDASFLNVKFSDPVSFRDAKFVQIALFEGAAFTADAFFQGASFAQTLSFDDSVSSKRIDFTSVKFSGSLLFRKTTFRNDGTMLPGPIFSWAEFEKPDRVYFYKANLNQALFHNCDVSKFNFSAVRWRRRQKTYGHWILRRHRFGKRYLFEEDVDLDCEQASELKVITEARNNLYAPERDYELIAETYQQLKKSYDDRRDFWQAGDFHYGEMEMLRLHSRFRLFPLRWIARNLSLTALYKYASAYGESMGRPLVWLAALVLMFALLFPFADLAVNPSQGEMGLTGLQVNYWNARQFFLDHNNENPVPELVRRMTQDHAALPLLVHSGMTALSVAGFQKELRYSPAYPWGRALALLELLLTTTLGGLFLLAIRRQYKRS